MAVVWHFCPPVSLRGLLEPDASKGASPVLRGAGRSNAPGLPGRWAVQDEQKSFGDLFNLVCDPATLLVAWERVKRNRGSRTAGVDGQTRKQVEQAGVDGVLAKLREELKEGTYRPLPARERLIPKRSGKLRSLGISALRDRIVQTAAKLVLEPIFEADFCPTSYGFRPGRRAQDAVEQVRFFIHAPDRMSG